MDRLIRDLRDYVKLFQIYTLNRVCSNAIRHDKSFKYRHLRWIDPYTGMIRWNEEVRMGYVPQSLVSTDLPISVEEFLRFKCRTDFETCIIHASKEAEHALKRMEEDLSNEDLVSAHIDRWTANQWLKASK